MSQITQGTDKEQRNSTLDIYKGEMDINKMGNKLKGEEIIKLSYLQVVDCLYL